MTKTIERSYGRLPKVKVPITGNAPSGTSIGTGNVALDFRGFAGGEIYIPADSSLTSLTWYVSPMPVGDDAVIAGEVPTYYQAMDKSNAAVTPTTVAAGKAYPLPTEIFGVGSIVIVGNTTGSVEISLKG